MNIKQQTKEITELEQTIAAVLFAFKLKTKMNVYAISAIQLNDGDYQMMTGCDVPDDYEISEDGIIVSECKNEKAS